MSPAPKPISAAAANASHGDRAYAMANGPAAATASPPINACRAPKRSVRAPLNRLPKTDPNAKEDTARPASP